MSNKIDPRPENLQKRVWESIQRDELPPQNDRGRMRVVMNNLVLHLHPSKVAKPTLKFTYTFGLGGLAMLLVALLAITGIMLMFVYTPSPDTAYQDMQALQTEIWYGQLIRNLHHWSGNLLVVTAFLHLLRVFFTGGFRTPREFNWVMGIILLLLAVAANFTGYLLPWDQLAYWAVTVGSSLLSYVPFIGEGLRNFLLGGPEVGAATLTNFYGMHVAIIPLILMGILSLHIWRVRKDTLTIPHRLDGMVEDGSPEGGKPTQIEKVTTLPHLVSREMVFALVMGVSFSCGRSGSMRLWKPPRIPISVPIRQKQHGTSWDCRNSCFTSIPYLPPSSSRHWLLVRWCCCLTNVLTLVLKGCGSVRIKDGKWRLWVR